VALGIRTMFKNEFAIGGSQQELIKLTVEKIGSAKKNFLHVNMMT
jgi:hypothetical protein